MRLYLKAFLFFALVGFTSLIILLTSSYSILLSSYNNLETQTTSQNVERVLSAIDSDIESLDAFTHDWASWDDSYQFIRTGTRTTFTLIWWTKPSSTRS